MHVVLKAKKGERRGKLCMVNVYTLGSGEDERNGERKLFWNV